MRITKTKHDMFKKTVLGLLTCLSVLCAAFCYCDSAVYAIDYTVRNETTKADYVDINEALSSAGNGDRLLLLKDCKLMSPVLNTCDVTVDMSGFSLDMNGYGIQNRAKLGFINSGGESGTHYFIVHENSAWTYVESPSEDQKAAAVDPDKTDSLKEDDIVKVEGSLIFSGGGTNGLGGAISNITVDGLEEDKKGSLSVNGISFVGCSAELGGVIENEGGDVTVNDVCAYGCSAVHGGFLYNANGCEASVDRVSIKFCTAGESGGAIVNNGTMEINDSLIADCTAASGGAIFNTYSLLIKDCEIKNCVASKYGGAIFNDGKGTGSGLDAKVVIENVSFDNCQAQDHLDPTGTTDYKEAIYVRNASLIMNSGYLENMIFTNDNTQDGDPVCRVEIFSGTFKDYTPRPDHVVIGSLLMSPEGGDKSIKYVVEPFISQPAPKTAKKAWDQKHTVSWKANSETDSFKILCFDDKKGDWTEYASVDEIKDGEASYSFSQTEKTAKTMRFKVVGYIDGAPVSFSEEFSIEWVDPASGPEQDDELVHHEAVPVTMEQDGMKEYWESTLTGKLYLDAFGKNEITDKTLLVIPISSVYSVTDVKVDGCSISMNVVMVRSVSYNSLKHVTKYSKQGKNTSPDVAILIRGNFDSFADVTAKDKNNKIVPVKVEKKPTVILQLKLKKTVNKEDKKRLKGDIKLINKYLKAHPFTYDITKADLNRATKITPKTNKTKAKVTGLTVTIDGKDIKLSKKDYKVLEIKDGKASIEGMGNFTGKITVVL